MKSLVNIEVYSATGEMVKQYTNVTKPNQIHEQKITFIQDNKNISVSYPGGIIVVTEV